MNETQQKVKKFMDRQIAELDEGLDHLQHRGGQPTDMGNVYNGMLKCVVPFEIEHMKNLRDELIKELR